MFFRLSFWLLYFFYLEMHTDFSEMFIILTSVNKIIIIKHKAQLFFYFYEENYAKGVCVHFSANYLQ